MSSFTILIGQNHIDFYLYSKHTLQVTKAKLHRQSKTM